MIELTDEQLEGMSRWVEEPDLPAFAKYCGPLAAAEIRSRRERALTDSHRVQVARLADALPINDEAERMVDAMMAKAIAAQPSRKLTMPALTAEEVEALAALNVALRHSPTMEGFYERHHGDALAVLDKLARGGK